MCLLVMYRDRVFGQRSSGLLFCFWLGMVVYGSIKLRTLLLLSIDNVRYLNSKVKRLKAKIFYLCRVVYKMCSDL